MRNLLLFLAASALSPVSALLGAAPDTRCFELRIYTAAPGKLDDLHARFRNHTLQIFEKHAMTSIGYWTPLENPENKLIYVLAFPSREAADQDWKEFRADPEWKKVAAESEANGKLVTKVESTFLQATDFSPEVKPSVGAAPRVFELRTYTATPNNLPILLKRFREHTLTLFTKHGMTNLFYWTRMPGQSGSDNTLVYMLAHPSKEAGDEEFKAFRADPDWIAAKDASEKEGGGSLTVLPDGVQSVYMQATDYSPTK
jgi:hypothetical protein